VFAQHNPITVKFLAENLLFIPTGIGTILYPGWTLSYEMFFYALFALSLTTRFRLTGFFAAILTLVAIGYALKPRDPIAETYTDPLLLEFAAGVAIGYVWVTGNLKVGRAVSVLAIAVGTFLLLRWNEPPFYGKTQTLGAILVIVGVLHPMFRERKNKLLLALGDASYSIYLTHPFVLASITVLWLMITPSVVTSIAVMALVILGCAGFGWTFYRYIERPMTQVLRHRVRHLAAVPSTQSASPP
jgi:exopolysaccharide production protein ExoZ